MADATDFSRLFPQIDLSKTRDNNYMRQFLVSSWSNGGDAGGSSDDSYFALNGADGKSYRLNTDYVNTGAFTLTGSDPLDNHNRFQLKFDSSGTLTQADNWKDKSFFDDNKGIFLVAAAAAGGALAFGSGGATAAAASPVATAETAAVSAPVYGGSAIGTAIPPVGATAASGGVSWATVGTGLSAAKTVGGFLGVKASADAAQAQLAARSPVSLAPVQASPAPPQIVAIRVPQETPGQIAQAVAVPVPVPQAAQTVVSQESESMAPLFLVIALGVAAAHFL